MYVYKRFKGILVISAFLIGFLYGIVLVYQEAYGELMSVSLVLQYLFYGCMVGFLFAGIIWMSVSLGKKGIESAKGENIVLCFKKLDKKKKIFIIMIFIIIIGINMVLFFKNVWLGWETTLEDAYEEALDSSEPPFSQLRIVWQKDYKNSHVIIACDRDNVCLYNFKSRYKNGKKEYLYSNSFRSPILNKYTKEDIEGYSFTSNLLGSRHNAYGATYSDISNLRINGEKPDYVIEEEINGRKVNVWFYEDLGDDFTIKDVEIEL